MTNNLEIQTLDVKLLKLSDANPRIVKDKKFKQLVQSIKDFPEMLKIRPIVVNKEMTVLGGNMRFRACIEAGINQVPVIVAENLTVKQESEFIIKDNVGFGEWDWDKLANEWDTDNLKEFGVDVPNFSVVPEDDVFEEMQIENEDKVLMINDSAPIICPDAKLEITRLLNDKIPKVTGTMSTFIGAKSKQTDNYLLIPSTIKFPEDLSNFILCFYTQDNRFEQYYNTPSKYIDELKRRGMTSIIMPNFSMYPHLATIQQLFNLYKSRWTARFFQECGFDVIPDIQLNKHVDYVLDGLEVGVNAIATQWHTDKSDKKHVEEKIETLRYVLNKLKPKQIIFYVDNKAEKILKEIMFDFPNIIPYYCASFMTEKQIIKQKIK